MYMGEYYKLVHLQVDMGICVYPIEMRRRRELESIVNYLHCNSPFHFLICLDFGLEKLIFLSFRQLEIVWISRLFFLNPLQWTNTILPSFYFMSNIFVVE